MLGVDSVLAALDMIKPVVRFPMMCGRRQRCNAERAQHVVGCIHAVVAKYIIWAAAQPRDHLASEVWIALLDLNQLEVCICSLAHGRNRVVPPDSPEPHLGGPGS